MRGASQIDLAADSDGENHNLHAAASETAGWLPGHYRYELRVADGSDVVTVESGELRIAPDFRIKPPDQRFDHHLGDLRMEGRAPRSEFLWAIHHGRL